MSKKCFQFEITLDGVTRPFKVEATSVEEAKRFAKKASFLGPVTYKHLVA